MGTRKTTKTAGAVKLTPAPDPSNALLLKNLSNTVIVIKSSKPDLEDVSVQIHGEIVLDQIWLDNRSVQALILRGMLAYEWVDKYYQTAVLPDAGSAPTEIIPDDSYEREFARQIAFGPKEPGLQYIAVTRTVESTGEIDVRYMKEHFLKVLRLALWYEERLKQRKPIIDALKERIDVIRSM
ncbi:MAG: hypothetical protein HY868_25510 [Chloroflexi bacterium]|nr:hypothetical protein [Chloroflexota bacterium]